MHPSPPDPDPLQLAVEQANSALRAYMRGLPQRRPETVAEYEEYWRLVEAFDEARKQRGPRRRESEDPPARAVLAA